ncbi:MAG: LytR C-terminal domain-containing protein [Actinomycetota bacterium]|nr:MAG: LytR C-terminal domain-containing protein [Actinomycetota bacterium]
MSNDQPAARGRRPGGMSVSATLSIIVAAIAVLLGFLVLRDINRESGDSSGPDTTDAPDSTTASTTAQSTSSSSSVPMAAFKLMVANASGVGGSARQMSTALQSRGFVVVDPTDAADSYGVIAASVVYTLAGYEAQGEAVATVLGGVEVLAMPSSPPIQTELGEATVLVMLGSDLAGKPLPTPATDTGTTDTGTTDTGTADSTATTG